MSDFDEEAERERLREKFEDDREKRKSTQHMSELLLKGATMTNRHCEVCSDPIFRYEGQEFCPTCQRANDGANADATETEPADTVEVTPESGDAETNADRGADAEHLGAAGGRGTAEGDGRARERQSSPRAAPQSTPNSRTEGDLDDARASLVRTLTRFARTAEAADDPRRAVDHLTAAREAAETLSALNR